MPNETDFAVLRSYWGDGYPQIKYLLYASDDQPVYVAIGARGKALTTPNWKVIRYTYVVGTGGSNIPDTIKTSPDNSIASDYLTLEYL
jgi:hypothetical protein